MSFYNPQYPLDINVDFTLTDFIDIFLEDAE